MLNRDLYQIYIARVKSFPSASCTKRDETLDIRMHIIIIIIYLAIRQCAARSSALIPHNFPERRKPRKRKETHIPGMH